MLICLQQHINYMFTTHNAPQFTVYATLSCQIPYTYHLPPISTVRTNNIGLRTLRMTLQTEEKVDSIACDGVGGRRFVA